MPSKRLRNAILPLLVVVIGCTDPTPAKPVTLATPETISTAKQVAPDTKPASAVSEPPTVASTSPSEPKSEPSRQPIYDTNWSGEELIAKAVREAKRDHKRVLIEWGFNSCVWCVRLHDLFQTDETVHPLITEKFVLVLVDSTSNEALLRQYGGKDRQYSYPHLTVLDDDGNVLTNQNTEPLEKGKGHDPKVVAQFLRKWVPQQAVE